ncbi:alpha-galactosidase [Xylanimonas sp. McL0601]|uniref:alpha-galactosidase n=1 Tax=Xylanimonas sp. McL0601 TaxID=3414739 RepID=UPI003CEBBFC0
MTAGTDDVVHLRAGGVSLVVEAGGGLPRVVHWGADLGDLDPVSVRGVATASVPPVVSGPVDQVVPLAVLPEAHRGWLGTPGLSGHRDGRAFAPAFVTNGVDLDTASDGAQRLVVRARDDEAALSLTLTIALAPSGLVSLDAALTNEDAAEAYRLEELLLALPVPTQATEILDFTGRHLRERAPQRHRFTQGTHLRENRRGRTGADATMLLLAGTPGFSFESGEVWGVHVAWSGNHRTLAERSAEGQGILAGGELLLPGELGLGPGETYRSPTVHGAWGTGLNALSWRFHDFLRARPGHPSAERPVLLNTWEAVYFDQDADTLRELVDAAADVGIERFVLDDGWFRGRRDDTAGLGDWYVDEGVWPDGLHPLVEHVREREMQFGLWFEPEMVNPDSDLARAHPGWILGPGGALPPEARHQQVLDLTDPEAYAFVLGRMDAIITEYGIDFVKWDHNRDLVSPGHGTLRTAGVHEQTLAVYRLIDTLRARHPRLEIESCASGGARVDLGILQRTDRVWASDAIDALERQQIERWTRLLLPPELIGSHVGAAWATATGRTQELEMRAGTAFFGSFGVERDLRHADEDERAALRAWIALYRRHQELLHTGRFHTVDHGDPSLQVHGVVARDRGEAVFSFVCLATSEYARPGLVRLPGLDPDAEYDVRPVPLAARVDKLMGRTVPPWWADGITLPGSVLSRHGVQIPALFPERLTMVHLERTKAVTR